MNPRKLFYKLQEYWPELLAFAFAIITTYFTFLYSKSPGTIFVISILLTVLFLLLTLYLHFKEKDFYFLALDSYSDKENWFGSGKFEFDKTNNAYVIADTDAGFIFAKCLLWKDYSVKGEFKVLNKCLGIILRASDLSNYVMLQVRKDCIRPHIRANGGWMPFEPDITGLTFEGKISDGNWYKFEFKVKGEDIEIKICDDSNVLINKSWRIPNGKLSIPVYDIKDDKRESFTHVMDIIISYDYGSVGFRNGHGERGLIKNLLIKNINS